MWERRTWSRHCPAAGTRSRAGATTSHGLRPSWRSRDSGSTTLGPGIGAALAHVSYTAPIWAAAGLSTAATILAWIWLPETVRHVPTSSTGAWRQLPRLFRTQPLGRVLGVDLGYWTAFAVYQTTFALFGQRRFGWDATHIGYILTVFGLIGFIVQGGLVGPVARALGCGFLQPTA